jgi:hypothetical protein
MPRPRQRVRLESGLKLDLNKLMRDGHVKRGQLGRGTISWSRGGESVAEGSLEVCLPPESPGWFALKVGSLDQRIQLHAAQRHFGGAQLYFVCPVTGRRVSVLWLPPGARRFASRHAWGRQVAYGSQFETPHDRALSTAQDIRHELGGKNYISLFELPPPKTKGMHWRTYEGKLKRLDGYETICSQYDMMLLARLGGRI